MTPPLEQIKLLYSQSKNQLALQNTLHILRFLLLAHELQSLKTFAAAPSIRPYMLRFLKELNENLKNPSDIQQSAFVQLVLQAFSTRYVSGPLKLLATYTLQFANPNISYEITQASIRVIHLLNQHVNLKEIHQTVVDAEQHCSSSSLKDTKGLFRSFGKKPPDFFFTKDPFYIIEHESKPESDEAKFERKIRRNFASASSLENSNQATPVNRYRHFQVGSSESDFENVYPLTLVSTHQK